MRLYNTLTRRIEEFVPAHDPARIYVCGVTPYDTTHLGHAFTYVVFDVLIRYLEQQGYRVRYVQNVTDVDSAILGRAAELGEPYQELGQRYLEEFVDDTDRLNLRRPDIRPRATQEVGRMTEIVSALVAKGAAYQRGGSVYYRVASFPDYGRLSGLPREEMPEIAQRHGGEPPASDKEAPLDFVLWQAAKPGEPTWDSPWGPGRPGWHIECSTMSLTYLGQRLDIHGGGRDLIFPHHENEIAQSEAYTGARPFARFWMHAGLVHLDGRPMSKSQGNMTFVSDLLGRYPAAAVRLVLLRHHYRQDWEYDEAEVSQGVDMLQTLRQAVSTVVASHASPALGWEGHATRFWDALDDDLDTPRALEALMSLAWDVVEGAGRGADVAEARRRLVEMCGVLGLRLDV